MAVFCTSCEAALGDRHSWPIATGVIKGASRHLVKDRMDITGARWGLRGAEAILKPRVIQSNGDATNTPPPPRPRRQSWQSSAN